MKTVRTLAACALWVGVVLALRVPAEAADAVKVGAGRQPQLAVDPAGRVFLAYGADDTAWCALSTDGGKSFAPAVKVGSAGSMALGMRRGPRIAATEKAVVVTAICAASRPGREGNVVAWRSTDQGKTWQGPARINAELESAREGLHALAAGPGEKLYCVWLDLRRGKTDLYGAASADGGASWSKDTLLYQSPDGHICECCHPSVAFDGKGGLLVMFRNALEGNRDPYLLRAAAGGKGFAPALKLGGGSWKIDKCPMDGGAVAGGADGAVFTTWRRRRQVYANVPGQPEKELGPGEQPWIAAGAKGPHIVWVTSRVGELLHLAPGGASPVQLAGGASDPVVASAPGGAPPVVAAWQAGDELFTKLLVPSAK